MASLRVLVIGPGALGRALGETLRAKGAEISCLGRGGESSPPFPEKFAPDLALVTVKAYDTESAVRAGRARIGGAPVLTLQNGLGNVEAIARAGVDPERIFGGATTHAARRLASGEVLHAARGETRIAPFDRRALGRGREIAQLLTAHGIETACEEDLQALLWRKLIVSCAVNPVTALEGCTNGELLGRPALAIAFAAAREALAIARALGVDVGDENEELRVRNVLERTAENRSSMLQDLEAARRTEIEEINGAVVRAAERLFARGATVNRELLRLVKERELRST
jgi:2-dehydropantoate 2-reductase